MREILFKAKRIDNGEWVEGYYMPRPNSPGKPRYYIVLLSQAKWYEIDPETLCQYTGQTDKNGQKIWENNIVRSTASENERDWKLWKVMFMDGSFVFVPIAYVEKTRRKLKCEDELLCEDNINLYGLERVGNIFDYPELLKEE